MKAFNNDPELKKKYRRRYLDFHMKGKFRRKYYPADMADEGLVPVIEAWATQDEDNTIDHLPAEIGIPQELLLCECTLYSQLKRANASMLGARFIEAIPVGADLSKVHLHFLLYLLAVRFPAHKKKRLREALVSLLRKKIAGEEINPKSKLSKKLRSKVRDNMFNGGSNKTTQMHYANLQAFWAIVDGKDEYVSTVLSILVDAYDAWGRPSVEIAETLLNLIRNAPHNEERKAQ